MEKVTGEVTEDAALQELAKYFKLCSPDTPMFSEYVDQAWHKLRMKPETYEKFCVEACGRVVEHHQFSDGDKVYYEIPWVAEYKEKYGPLPMVWFADKAGVVDKSLLAGYKKSGKVERLPPRAGPFMTCDCKKA